MLWNNITRHKYRQTDRQYRQTDRQTVQTDRQTVQTDTDRQTDRIYIYMENKQANKQTKQKHFLMELAQWKPCPKQEHVQRCALIIQGKRRLSAGWVIAPQ